MILEATERVEEVQIQKQVSKIRKLQYNPDYIKTKTTGIPIYLRDGKSEVMMIIIIFICQSSVYTVILHNHCGT